MKTDPDEMRTATLAKVAERLNRRYRRDHGGGLPPLLVLTDERRMPDPLAALDRLPPGNGVILRHYGLPWSERRALAAAMRAASTARKLLFLIAGDVDLARDTEADGIHLPEHAVTPEGRVPEGFGLVTAAAHSPEALARAARAGADAALLSPVFTTASHPDAVAIGVARAARWLARAALPVYALGGVSDETAPQLLRLPFAGLAAVGAFAPERGSRS